MTEKAQVHGTNFVFGIKPGLPEFWEPRSASLEPVGWISAGGRPYRWTCAILLPPAQAGRTAMGWTTWGTEPGDREAPCTQCSAAAGTKRPAARSSHAKRQYTARIGTDRRPSTMHAHACVGLHMDLSLDQKSTTGLGQMGTTASLPPGARCTQRAGRQVRLQEIV